MLLPSAGARADAREEGPREIEKCQTISKPGSYRLVNDLTFTLTTGTCLAIAASSVTIDLAGFTISGPGFSVSGPTAIAAQPSSGNLQGIVVRNGSISGFTDGVALGAADGSVVEGLRVFGVGCPCSTGIVAKGIVRGNTVVGIAGLPITGGVGISATGIVTGNYVTASRRAGIEIGPGSTVIGNTASDNIEQGISVTCPSNVTDNTAVNTSSGANLVLIGEGCNNTNNVAP